MGIFNNYLNSMVSQQSKNILAKPQALNVLRFAVAKQANGPYTPKPADILADTLVRYTAPKSTHAPSTAPAAFPVESPTPKAGASGLKAGLAALSMAAAKVGTFISQVTTGAGAKLAAAFGSGYAALTSNLAWSFRRTAMPVETAQASENTTVTRADHAAEAKPEVSLECVPKPSIVGALGRLPPATSMKREEKSGWFTFRCQISTAYVRETLEFEPGTSRLRSATRVAGGQQLNFSSGGSVRDAGLLVNGVLNRWNTTAPGLVHPNVPVGLLDA